MFKILIKTSICFFTDDFIVFLPAVAKMTETLLDPSVLKVLSACSALLIFKVLLMAPLTARWRLAKKIVISPEDVALVGRKGKVGEPDPDIERVRNAHRNDLENIPLFLITAFLFALTKPSPVTANLLITLYTLARFAHTFVYAIVVIKQPARFLAFATGMAINIYMAIVVLNKAWE